MLVSSLLQQYCLIEGRGGLPNLPRHYGLRSTDVRTGTEDAFARCGCGDKVICETVVRRPEDGDEDAGEQRYDEYRDEEECG